MTSLCLAVLGATVAFALYTYLGYPLLLMLLRVLRRNRPPVAPLAEWPSITIVLPVFNEEAVIRNTLENLLQLDYPADRRQILVLSDASTDRTEAMVSEYARRGVQLLRMPRRRGKTAAENAALALLRGEIIVNTDASVWVERGALKPLIATFADPTVGVASGPGGGVAAGGVPPQGPHHHSRLAHALLQAPPLEPVPLRGVLVDPGQPQDLPLAHPAPQPACPRRPGVSRARRCVGSLGLGSRGVRESVRRARVAVAGGPPLAEGPRRAGVHRNRQPRGPPRLRAGREGRARPTVGAHAPGSRAASAGVGEDGDGLVRRMTSRAAITDWHAPAPCRQHCGLGDWRLEAALNAARLSTHWAR